MAPVLRGREGRAALLVVASSVLAILVGALAGDDQAEARPSTPGDDSAVIARVPSRKSDPAARALALLGQQLARDARDLPTALRLARLGIEEARRRSDPRLL